MNYLLGSVFVIVLVFFSSFVIYNYIKSPIVFLLNILSVVEYVYKLSSKIGGVKRKLISLSEKHRHICKFCERVGWIREICKINICVKTKEIHHAVYINIRRPAGILISLDESMASQCNYNKEALSLYSPTIYGKIESLASIRIFTERKGQFMVEISMQVLTDELIRKGRIIQKNIPIRRSTNAHCLIAYINLDGRKISMKKSNLS